MRISSEFERFVTVSNTEYCTPKRKNVAIRAIQFAAEPEYLKYRVCGECEVEWCPAKDLLRNKTRQEQSRIKAVLEELDNGWILVTLRFASRTIAQHRELMISAKCVRKIEDDYEGLVFSKDDATLVTIRTDD